ncbi:hypothetical protein IFM89_013556 [Coptis chinensis]|uniref:Uncharacterized protein n=1 Tax=Coptis chinensis TaxID=261450 RepID=A0A835I0Q5_9MAGN|nr:hypothetical protein IFM89_013556 [Coptis chinensis]
MLVTYIGDGTMLIADPYLLLLLFSLLGVDFVVETSYEVQSLQTTLIADPTLIIATFEFRNYFEQGLYYLVDYMIMRKIQEDELQQLFVRDTMEGFLEQFYKFKCQNAMQAVQRRKYYDKGFQGSLQQRLLAIMKEHHVYIHEVCEKQSASIGLGLLVLLAEVLEARDLEYRAWAHVRSLNSSLDEHNLESHIKAANEAKYY